MLTKSEVNCSGIEQVIAVLSLGGLDKEEKGEENRLEFEFLC